MSQQKTIKPTKKHLRTHKKLGQASNFGKTQVEPTKSLGNPQKAWSRSNFGNFAKSKKNLKNALTLDVGKIVRTYDPN